MLVAEAPEGAKSIAVLPFANLSADPENEYFSDGMTEEIINAASSQVQGTLVPPGMTLWKSPPNHHVPGSSPGVSF